MTTIATPFQRTAFERLRERFRGTDTTFMSIIGLSLALHVTTLLHAMSLPEPVRPKFEDLTSDREIVVYPIRVPKPEPTPEPQKEHYPKSRHSPQPTAHKTSEAPKEVAPVNTEREPAIRQLVANSPIIKAIRDSMEQAGGLNRILGAQPTLSLDDLVHSGKNLHVNQVASNGGLKPVESGPGPIGIPQEVETTGASSELKPIASIPRRPPRPQVVPEEPVIDGNIDADAVNAVFTRHIGAIKGCYEKALKLNPTLSGKFALTVAIETEGQVLESRMRAVTGHSDEVFVTCVGERVRTWRFAKMTESTEVTFNIFLTPQKNGVE